jgi:rod shape-determining protein MreC
VLVLLLLTAFTLITLDFRAGHSGPFGALRGVASAVFGPIERAVTAVVRPVGDTFASVGHLGRYKHEVADLKAENARLNAQLRTSDADRRQLAEMQGLLHLAGRGQFRVVGARVVGIGRSLGFEWTATIDAGSSDGIRTDMTVINGAGLVGRVKNVGPTTSTVLLAVDGDFSVGARLEKSGEIGHVDGAGSRPMSFTLLSAQTPLKPGQRLVTVGSVGERPFVPEVPIGHIIEVKRTPGALTRTGIVEPYVDFTALDVVGVVIGAPARIPRDSLLPTPPPKSPAPKPSGSTASLPPARPSGSGSPAPSASP